MNNFFVTGTDTGVGKTVISAVLTLILEGFYWKPIQSGIEYEIPDQECVQQLTQLPDARFISSNYSFKASLSPDQAAKLENSSIHLDQINLPTSLRLIIEGAGGILVPLNDYHNMLDLIKKLAAKVVIVTRGTLGTINHTLLTIEVLRQYKIDIHGIIFNGELNPKNQSSIEKWGKVKTLFHMPLLTELTPKHFQAWVIENKNNILENFL